MTDAKAYSTALMAAVQSTGDVLDHRALLDALMMITSMVLLGTDDDWTDGGLELLAAAYGTGILEMLLGMAEYKRSGGHLPFQVGRM